MKSAFRILLFLALLSCRNEKLPQENTKVQISAFSQDSAHAFIEKQVAFGKREMNSTAHEECKDWLVNKLEGFGFAVSEQKFSATSYENEILNGTNIIGRYKPEVKERMLLCAHYDTRHIADKDTIHQDLPIEGADDGGSGVAVCLEIARQIHNNPMPMGLDIIFFDAEDHGSPLPGQHYTWGLGSQYWSKNLHEEPYHVKYGILLDMVGSRGATFPLEGYSLESASSQVSKIWRLADALGNQNYFVRYKVPALTDDHRFIIENTDIPMLDVINVKRGGTFGVHHHTHQDILEIIDKKTLKAVGQVILAVIYKESNQDQF